MGRMPNGRAPRQLDKICHEELGIEIRGSKYGIRHSDHAENLCVQSITYRT